MNIFFQKNRCSRQAEELLIKAWETAAEQLSGRVHLIDEDFKSFSARDFAPEGGRNIFVYGCFFPCDLSILASFEDNAVLYQSNDRKSALIFLKDKSFENLKLIRTNLVLDIRKAAERAPAAVYAGELREEFISYCIKTLWSRFFAKPQSAAACHGGDMGDIIYSIPAFKKLNVKKIILHPGGFYETKFDRKCAEILAPFLKEQGFDVKISEKVSLQDADYFFDIFREGVEDMENKHLSLTNCEKLFIKPDYENYAAQAKPVKAADIIVARSFRYRNSIADYRYLLSDLPLNIRIAFIGLKKEYENFCSSFGLRERVFYLPTENLLEAASYIKGSSIFIGNQSSPYALAEILKAARIQETCALTPNCKGSSDNSLDIISRDDLYAAKTFILNSLGIKKEALMPARRVLLAALCRLDSSADRENILLWLRHYIKRKERMGFSNILLVDDGSSLESLQFFKSIFAYSFVQVLRKEKKRELEYYNISPDIFSREISLISFENKIYSNNPLIRADFWRGYSFSAFAALNFNFEKLIFCDVNAFALSDRMMSWIKNKDTGFNCVYETPNMKRSASIQVLGPDAIAAASSYFCDENGLKEDFWFGFSRSIENYSPEFILPFTNRPDEFASFKIKKYGSDDFACLPRDADAVVDLTKSGKGHLFREEKIYAYEQQESLCA